MGIIDRVKALGQDLEGDARSAMDVVLGHLHSERDQLILALEAEVAKLPAEQQALKDFWSKLKLRL